MLEMLGDLTFGIIVISCGAGVGWLLQRLCRRAAAVPEEQRMAKEVLARLKDLASHMATNVGQHSSRVEQINQEMTANRVPEPEGVISAVEQLIAANQSMQAQLSTVEVKLNEQLRLVDLKAGEARNEPDWPANRRAFDDKGGYFDEFQRSRRPCSLILATSTTSRDQRRSGHQTGDEVLRSTPAVWRVGPETISSPGTGR